jgi:hypothetical protein
LKASGWLIFISLISDYVVKSFSFATSRHWIRKRFKLTSNFVLYCKSLLTKHVTHLKLACIFSGKLIKSM